jgi:hypothetical protein
LGALKLVTQGVTEKYLNTPEKAWDCAAIPDKYRQSMSRWLGKKVIGLESMLAGVSPDVIHLYNVRTCIDKIKIKEV